MSEKKIVVLATLDTKGIEAQYLKEKIESLGESENLLPPLSNRWFTKEMTFPWTSPMTRFQLGKPRQINTS